MNFATVLNNFSSRKYFADIFYRAAAFHCPLTILGWFYKKSVLNLINLLLVFKCYRQSSNMALILNMYNRFIMISPDWEKSTEQCFFTQLLDFSFSKDIIQLALKQNFVVFLCGYLMSFKIASKNIFKYLWRIRKLKFPIIEKIVF